MKRKKREEWSLAAKVEGPQGKFAVSTVRTYMGGAPDMGGGSNPFSTKDYANETPWPYETMVFKEVGVTGQYHQPSASKAAAEREHQRVIDQIKDGTFEIGKGVTGQWGTPATSPQEWKKLAA